MELARSLCHSWATCLYCYASCIATCKIKC